MLGLLWLEIGHLILGDALLIMRLMGCAGPLCFAEKLLHPPLPFSRGLTQFPILSLFLQKGKTISVSENGSFPSADPPSSLSSEALASEVVDVSPANPRARSMNNASLVPSSTPVPAASPIVLIAKPLARVLLLHTGGTLGMDSHASYEEDAEGHAHLVPGTGGKYPAQRSLKPGNMLNNLLGMVPELRQLANLDLKVVFNRDSCNVGPKEWVQIAKTLDANRRHYDAFLVVHGTDTMAYTAAAVSLMLAGFRKPIVFTGSQLPLAMPRSDARQNLIDSLTCATSSFSPPHVHLQV